MTVTVRMSVVAHGVTAAPLTRRFAGGAAEVRSGRAEALVG